MSPKVSKGANQIKFMTEILSVRGLQLEGVSMQKKGLSVSTFARVACVHTKWRRGRLTPKSHASGPFSTQTTQISQMRRPSKKVGTYESPIDR